MFNRKEWILLLTLAFIQFSHIVDFMILMPLGPQLMRTFQISPQQFGLLVSAYTFAAGISGLTSSLFIDRFDRKRSLLLFYCGFSIGTIFCALSEDYSGLLTARFLTGAFGGVLSSLVMSIVGDSIAAEKRASAMGIVMAAFSGASIFGVPFSLYLANHFDWHAPFTFLGSLSLFMILVIMTYIPNMQNHMRPKELRKNPFKIVLGFFTRQNTSWALLFLGLLVFGQFSVIPFLSPSMVSNAGMLEDQLPLIYLIGGCVSIVSSPLIGRLADKYGKRKIFIVSAAVSMLPFYIVTNLTRTPLPVLLLIIAFFFLCMGGRMVPASAMMTQAVLPENRGAFMSITSSVQNASAALASFTAGVIVGRNELGELVDYNIVGYVAIVFSLLAIFISTKMRPSEGTY